MGLPGFTMAPPATSTKIHSTPYPSLMGVSAGRSFRGDRAWFSGSQSIIRWVLSMGKGAHMGVLPWYRSRVFSRGVMGVLYTSMGGPNIAGICPWGVNSAGSNFESLAISYLHCPYDAGANIFSYRKLYILTVAKSTDYRVVVQTIQCFIKTYNFAHGFLCNTENRRAAP